MQIINREGLAIKVLIIDGSPRKNGNTHIALEEMMKIFRREEIETDYVSIGGMEISGCMECEACGALGKCIKDDIVNVLAEKLIAADGLVIGSPVFYASANGTLVSCLDRLFYSMCGRDCDLRMKVGAAVCAARRGGLTATFDQLNKYFTIRGMPVASGQYWNGIHGTSAGEAVEDPEGLQQMRTLAENMIFLMRSIALGKERYGLPQQEKPVHTNFIR